MPLRNVLAIAGDALNARLFAIGGKPISLATLLTVALILVLGRWLSRLLRGALSRAFAKRGVREGTIAAMARLAHYIMLVVTLSVAAQTIGIDLSALFAAGAVFAVALGFAMQNIVQNFVSGVILLVERSIKPGDILGIEGNVMRVLAMRIRSTIVQTRDGEDIVVPNSVLVQSSVKNYTLQDSYYRVRATVGVVYHADMDRVEQTLRRVTGEIPWCLDKPEPQVLMLEFGDNSVNWEVALWVQDPWRSRVYISQLNRAIWNALKAEDIVIAFPQLDLHLDAPVMESLRRLGGAH